jgi:serine/threonine-protein kinase
VTPSSITGQTLGHYRVLERLGAGGMGEVYRAADLKLGRDIAIKLLPDAFAHDPERLARFEREAHLLAALNHPNIAAIHGLEEAHGLRFLVLELVPGETLGQQLARGPLPADEAVRVMRQVAEALEAAHDRGIIHRDLKPANIKVTPQGQVKVLDFGLAKTYEAGPATTDSSNSPTLTVGSSREGVILGTAAYMSPEQARGRLLDRRTDVWSFGCVFYEALTARPAFRGDTVTDTIAAIVKEEPDWKALPAETPGAVRALLGRCLQKDAQRRPRSLGDAMLVLDEALTAPEAAEVPSAGVAAAQPAAPRWRTAVPWVLAGVLALAVVVANWQLMRATRATPPGATRFLIAPPADVEIPESAFPHVAFSPDGKGLVYVGRPAGKQSQLYWRAFDRLDAQPIPGTADADRPFFSSDGKWVAFTGNRKLKKVSLEGGAPLELCDAEWGGGAWLADGTIVFTPFYAGGLMRVPAAGGQPEQLTTPDATTGELGHWWPQALPDGETILVTLFSAPLERSRIALLSLKTRQLKVILEGGTHARYLPSGHIVFSRGTTLLAVGFDPARRQTFGTPVPVLDGVAFDLSNGNAQYSVSPDGALAYIPEAAFGGESRLVWKDRQGKAQPVTEQPRRYGTPAFSPDGRRVAVTVEGENTDIWVYDLERGGLSRLTFGPATDFHPMWTPDGKRVIYISERPVYNLYWKAADGTGTEEPIWAGPYDTLPGSVSPDGKFVAYVESNPKTQGDILLLPLTGTRQPQPFLNTPFNEQNPAFSPDGRWLAYESYESGRPEVYVVPFPGPGERHQVSTDGGLTPQWARSGGELFYRRRDKLMAVSMRAAPSFSAGRPQEILDLPPLRRSRNWVPAPDGRRFLIVEPLPAKAPAQIHVVLNWAEELKRRVK